MQHLIDIGKGLLVDDQRARQLLPNIEQRWRSQYRGFATLDRVESRLRPTGLDSLSEERLKAVFIFLQAFSQRSGKPATTILGNLRRWWETHPELLDPLNALEETPEFFQFVREVDPQYRDGVLDREIIWWQQVIRILREDYQGNPLNLFYHPNDGRPTSFLQDVMEADMESWEQVSALRSRIANYLISFKGVQLKVASMFMIFFQEATWTDYPEFWARIRRIPFIPFDVHHIRLMRMLGFVNTTDVENDRVRFGHRDLVGPALSNYLSRLCYELKLEHFSVAQAFYNVGAVIHHNWNKAKRNQHRQHTICYSICPFHDICEEVVHPDQALNAKKKGRGAIGRLMREAERREALAAGTLPAQTGVQLELGTGAELSLEELARRRAEIGPETKNRGQLWVNLSKRPPPLYHGDLFSEDDSPVPEP